MCMTMPMMEVLTKISNHLELLKVPKKKPTTEKEKLQFEQKLKLATLIFGEDVNFEL